MANTLIFFAEKMWVAFAMQKLLTFFQQKISMYLMIFYAEKMWVAFAKATHIFSAKIIKVFENTLATTVNEFVINELIKPMILWTIWALFAFEYTKKSFWKGVYSERKEFAFLLEHTPFQKGDKI